MKYLISILMMLILGSAGVAFALPILTVPQGGTGGSTFPIGECIKGNGAGAFTSGACGTSSFSYDAWTHPSAGVSATTSSMIFTNASSTFTGDLNITGNSTTTNSTTTVARIGLLTLGTALSDANIASASTWNAKLSSVTADSPLSGSGTSASHLVLSTAGTWTGLAGTATALAANGGNCTAGNYPLGVDASGAVEDCTAVAGSTWPFTSTTNYGTAVQSTSTPLWFTNGLMASSTSHFVNASTTLLTVGTLYGGAGGSNTQVQFNDGSSFGGDSGLTWDKSLDNLTITSASNGLHINGADGGIAALSIDNTVGSSFIYFRNQSLTSGSRAMRFGMFSDAFQLQGLSDDYGTTYGPWLSIKTATGETGISTSSPYARFAIQNPYGSTNSILFAVASSTASNGSSSSLLFTIPSSAAGTSTFATGLAATYLNITGTSATSTFARGIDLAGGCFAVSGVCVGGSGTVTSVAASVPTGWTVTGSPITTSGTLAFAYDTGYAAVKTASTTNWNSFYDTPSGRITDGTGLTWSTNTLNCDTASGTVQGCLTSTDWTTFNNKQATISATYPLILTGATLSTALSTTTLKQTYGTAQSGDLSIATSSDTNILLNVSNTNGAFTFAPAWTGTLADARITSASTWNAKLSSVTADSPLSGSGTSASHLVLDTSGTWTGVAGTATALATPRAINGVNFDGTAAITITAASSTLLANNNTWTGLNAFSNATSTLFTSTTAWVGTLNLTNDLTVANGGTGASTLTGLLQGNGTSAFTALSDSSTVGQILRVTGASTYAWGALNLDDTDAFTGTLPMSATQLTAGRSLTLTTDDVAADTELYTFGVSASLFATTTSGISTTTENFVSLRVPIASTITGFNCYADETGTSTIRATVASNPLAAGTDILYTTGVRCGAQVYTATSTFGTTAVAAGSVIRFYVSDASPTGSRPNVVYPSFTLTKDD